MLRFTAPRLILSVLLSSAFIGATPAWSGPPEGEKGSAGGQLLWQHDTGG